VMTPRSSGPGGEYSSPGRTKPPAHSRINTVTETAMGISRVATLSGQPGRGSATDRLGHFWKAEAGQFWRAPKDTGLKEFKIVLHGVDFGDFSDIASDAFQNLRNTLDHACAASAWASGVTRSRPCAYFPIGTTSDDLEKSIRRKCKDLPPDVIAAIRTFKPYKTGRRDPFLWFLAQTANVDKHAVISPYVPSLWTVVIGGPATLERPLKWVAPAVWNPGKNEIVYATTPADVTPHHSIHPKIDITIAEGYGVVAMPALLALGLIAREVADVLVAIEAETRLLFPGAF
jgi:hypothetical protein